MQGCKAQLGRNEHLYTQECPALSKGSWKHLQIPEAVVQRTWTRSLVFLTPIHGLC